MTIWRRIADFIARRFDLDGWVGMDFYEPMDDRLRSLVESELEAQFQTVLDEYPQLPRPLAIDRRMDVFREQGGRRVWRLQVSYKPVKE